MPRSLVSWDPACPPRGTVPGAPPLMGRKQTGELGAGAPHPSLSHPGDLLGLPGGGSRKRSMEVPMLVPGSPSPVLPLTGQSPPL